MPAMSNQYHQHQAQLANLSLLFPSVLPPPPKYPAGSGAGPLLETNNILQHHIGSETQLVVGEGAVDFAYRLSDDRRLITSQQAPTSYATNSILLPRRRVSLLVFVATTTRWLT